MGILLCGSVFANEKRVAVVVDTSGSMQSNDPGRHAVLAAQLLADLLDDSDAYSVVRLADGEMFGCVMEQANSSLEVVFDGNRRRHSKSRIDGLIGYDGGNHFCAPVRTALRTVSGGPADAKRMILFVADADDFGTGGSVLRSELSQFGSSGGLVASLTVRDDSLGEFVGPPFTYAERARSSKGIVLGLAKLYQRFIGSANIQSGALRETIELNVDPFVSSAYVVVADRGRVAAPLPRVPHPSVGTVDANYRGGGVVSGLDGIERSYAITRLERPESGKWTFDVRGGGGEGGWMFIQEYAIGIRAVADLVVPVGVPSEVVVELFDVDKRSPITDLRELEGAEVYLEHEGRTVRLNDDGTNGDAVAGDGRFTGQISVEKAGPLHFQTRVKTPFSEQRESLLGTGVVASWRLTGSLPDSVTIGDDVEVRVTATPTAPRFASGAPGTLTGPLGITLRDDGLEPDLVAGDRQYTGLWRPSAIGAAAVSVSAGVDPLIPPLTLQTMVNGVIKLAAGPMSLGPAESGETSEARIDWSGGEIRGTYDFAWSCPFRSAGSVLELWNGASWVPLDGATTNASTVAELSDRVRVRVGTCPSAFRGPVRIELTAPDGTKIPVPATVEILSDPWLRCYWWIPAGAAAILSIAWWINGWMFPSRFSRSLAIVLATEESLEDANEFQVRYARGFRRRWRRDDVVYVQRSYSLSARPGGAVARIRAERRSLKIRAESGAALETRGWEGDWEKLPDGETTTQVGAVYRLAGGGLYFQVRARV